MAESFGEALTRLRIKAGMTKPELAQRVPVSRASLSRYEGGRQQPEKPVVARLDKLVKAEAY
jgi:transcriptional regulator with XRE-family HTH domain